MNENSRWSRITTRTTLITVAAVAGVVIAGGAAVAANIGILDAADDDELGTLSAAIDPSGGTEVIDVYPRSTTSTSIEDGAGATQAFTVDRAGLVTVARHTGALRVAEVVANPGWTWSVDADDAATVAVRFTDGTRTLVFPAPLGPEGGVAGAVSETPPPPVVGPTGSDDDHDDDRGDDHDDDEHEDEQEHEDEHEGRDDDD